MIALVYAMILVSIAVLFVGCAMVGSALACIAAVDIVPLPVCGQPQNHAGQRLFERRLAIMKRLQSIPQPGVFRRPPFARNA